MWEQTKITFLDAIGRMAQAVARLLPGVIAMLLLLILAAIVAAVASWLLRRAFARLDVDRRLREWGMAAPAQPDRLGPSRLAARLVAWSILALGLLGGLSAFESSATSTLALRLLDYVPHALVGMLVFAAGIAGARALERSVLIGAVNMGLHSARLLGLGVRWLVVILAAAMALEQLGIGGTILTTGFAIAFGGIALSMSLAIGLGAKDLVTRSLARRLQDQAEGEAQAGEKLHHL